MLEALFFEKLLGLGAHAVGEQSDAFEILLFGKLHDVIDEPRPVALAAVVGVDHDILHQDDKAAAGGGNGEQQVHHPEDPVHVAHHENPPAVRLFEDQTQAALLKLGIWGEVPGIGKQVHHQFRQGWQILKGGGLHTRRIVHRAAGLLFGWALHCGMIGMIFLRRHEFSPAPGNSVVHPPFTPANPDGSDACVQGHSNLSSPEFSRGGRSSALRAR